MENLAIAATAKSNPGKDIDKAIQRYNGFENDLNDAFLEMEDEVRAILIGLISKHNVWLIGPPGTSKSLLVEVISQAMLDEKDLPMGFFQYLINRYTTPDELLGHFSLKKLKEDDLQVRRVAGKLPEAIFAFLDEWEKGNSGTQNSLLTMMNERKYDVGDGTRKKAPLEMVVGASNGYLKNPELAALCDRWMFRVETSYIVQDKNWDRLLFDKSIGKIASTIKWSDILLIRERADNVDLGGLRQVLHDIRQELSERKIVVSDRRWRNIPSILRAEAAVNGRTVAIDSDCGVLRHILWSTQEQKKVVAQIINKLCNSEMNKATEVKALADGIYQQHIEMKSSGITDLNEWKKIKGGIEDLYDDSQKLDAADKQIIAITDRIKSQVAEIKDHFRFLVYGNNRNGSRG